MIRNVLTIIFTMNLIFGLERLLPEGNWLYLMSVIWGSVGLTSVFFMSHFKE